MTTTTANQEHRRQGFRLSDGTRKLIVRLKVLIRETEGQLREERIWERTPFAQRPPRSHSHGALATKATVLYATRALMRGKSHIIGGVKPENAERNALEYIEKMLTSAENYEKKTQKSHDLFPSWLRATIRAALASIEFEKKRWEKHNTRYAARAAKGAAA